MGRLLLDRVLGVLGTAVSGVLGPRVSVMVHVAPTVVACVVVGPSPSLSMAGQLQSYWRIYVDEAVKL